MAFRGVYPVSLAPKNFFRISPFHEESKHTYEHFFTGISFSRSASIQDTQIIGAFRNWLKDEAAASAKVSAARLASTCNAIIRSTTASSIVSAFSEARASQFK
jgi:hypothetical protein